MFGDAVKVTAGILDCHDAGQVRQRRDSMRQDIGDRARWYVVKDQRQIDILGQGGEMGGNALLIRTIVIRRYNQTGRCSAFFRKIEV